VVLPLWIAFLTVIVPRYGEGLGVLAVATALQLSYYHLAEVKTGQSLGKRVVGLRVVSLDGGLPGHRQAAARTVLRLIDHSPPLIGLLAMLCSGGRRQRLGDVVAGTAVVRADAHPVAARPWTLAKFGYPLAWIAPALVLFALWTTGHFPGSYRADVDEICAEEAAEWGTQSDPVLIETGYARLQSRLAGVSVPGNWRERHAELTHSAWVEALLAQQVGLLYRRGDEAASRRRFGTLAATAGTNNARLARLGYRDCAGDRLDLPSVLGDDLVDESVLDGLFGPEEPVTLHVPMDRLERLPGVLDVEVLELRARLEDLPRVDLDVGRLPLEAGGGRLVDEDAAVG